MARCIDLFIDVVETDSGGGRGWGGSVPAIGGPTEHPWQVGPVLPASLAEMAAELTAIAGLRLTEELGGRSWVATVDGARAVLAEHDLVDDRYLALSRYRYDLFARVPSADANTSPEAALLRRILGLVKADGRFRALLVWDLQNVIGQAVGGAGGDRMVDQAGGGGGGAVGVGVGVVGGGVGGGVGVSLTDQPAQ